MSGRNFSAAMSPYAQQQKFMIPVCLRNYCFCKYLCVDYGLSVLLSIGRDDERASY